ncbi:MAG: DNA (cytosine-5-)-methyltransferase [Clostridia bacterium]|nr:DNA (cytosine-5-)-methyltransferase [Clostridia bacterium]
MGRLKVASLFCGCGGTDMGLLGDFTFLGKYYPSNNMDIVYANDIDDNACRLFEENFGIKPDNRDIREVKSEELPDFDILTGGFPCQSFSIVAQNPKRLGIKDDRGKLFFEMCRILREKQPICFIAENVKGIMSANKKEAFPLIIEEFEKSGYTVTHSLLNAANYGVPQKRERVIIVGFRNNLGINFEFPNMPITEEIEYVPLEKVIDTVVAEKYFFSERAVRGMMKNRETMNKGRVQDIKKPCNTVGSHLAKVSLNSTDPVLMVNGRYRRFTPREVARIQSFPEQFSLVGTEAAQYRALGNAIPPVMFWYVAKETIKCVNDWKRKKI